MVINTYVNACIIRLENGTGEREPLLAAMKKVRKHTELVAKKIYEHEDLF